MLTLSPHSKDCPHLIEQFFDLSSDHIAFRSSYFNLLKFLVSPQIVSQDRPIKSYTI
jgi:hypothetical protein